MRRLINKSLVLLSANNVFRFSDHKDIPLMYKKETKEQLKQRLTPVQYDVTQNSGTERPYTSKYCFTQASTLITRRMGRIYA
jgi:hypothetical protein